LRKKGRGDDNYRAIKRGVKKKPEGGGNEKKSSEQGGLWRRWRKHGEAVVGYWEARGRKVLKLGKFDHAHEEGKERSKEHTSLFLWTIEKPKKFGMGVRSKGVQKIRA